MTKDGNLRRPGTWTLFLQPRKARRMFGGLDFSQFCVLSCVQVCGLASAALARITEGRPWQALFQRMFLGFW